VVLGCIIPLLLLSCGRLSFATPNRIVAGFASALALIGLLIFEWCFVMAGQSVPNS
jgi:hypothetical protein